MPNETEHADQIGPRREWLDALESVLARAGRPHDGAAERSADAHVEAVIDFIAALLPQEPP